MAVLGPILSFFSNLIDPVVKAVSYYWVYLQGKNSERFEQLRRREEFLENYREIEERNSGLSDDDILRKLRENSRKSQ